MKRRTLWATLYPHSRRSPNKPAAALAQCVMLAAVLSSLSHEPAEAERIVASLSTHQVMITSSFTGLDLVLFGSVERDAASVPRRTGYDLIATVTGPRADIVTRRKERVLGIWVNVASHSFLDLPSYAAVLSSRPYDAFINAENQRRLGIGLMAAVFPQDGSFAPPDPFRMAVLRVKASRRLFSEMPGAVTFLTPTLFRAPVYLPAEVWTGTYDVDLKLFADGAMIARTSSAFEVVKVGFEQFIANSAQTHGFVYGLITAAMALMTGWVASVVFRKD